MGYVPGFEYDLFLSYASDDFDEKLEGLVEGLRGYLRKDLGKDFPSNGIFLDRHELNQTPIQWKEKLKDSAKSAAILLPVLSPSWATSKYCAKEWEWFSETHPLSWKAGEQTVYRVSPVHWRALDAEIAKQIPQGISSAQDSRSANVEELGAKIAQGLRLMRRSRQTVYVGESEHEVREKVRDELSRMGFRVMPEAAAAYGDPAIVKALLGEAKLAVHFVGNQEAQRAIAAIEWSRQYCQSATVVYELPGVDLSDEERLSLEWLEEDIRQSPATDSRVYDRISGKNKNLDQFLQVLEDRLEGMRPLPPTQVGIACEDPDLHAVQSIIPHIQERTNFSVICHGMSLLDFKKSRGVLFYWGSAEGLRLRKARLVLKTVPSFFLAPPPKPEQSGAELTGCEVLRQRAEQFDIEDIRPFLVRLGWKG